MPWYVEIARAIDSEDIRVVGPPTIIRNVYDEPPEIVVAQLVSDWNNNMKSLRPPEPRIFWIVYAREIKFEEAEAWLKKYVGG